MKKFNVTWATHSVDAAGSMPLGNGDVALNAWIAEDARLHLYLAKGDAWGEYGQLYKLGRLRLSVQDESGDEQLVEDNLRWTLDLASGSMRAVNSLVSLRLWVDSNHPKVHFEARALAGQALRAEVKIRPWRVSRREIVGQEKHCLHTGSPYPVHHEADQVLSLDDDRLGWCHHNRNSSWRSNLEQQDLPETLASSDDPLLNRCFGALVSGRGLSRTDEFTLRSDRLEPLVSGSVTVLTQIVSAVGQWVSACRKAEADAPDAENEQAWAAHCRWWETFFERNRFEIGGSEAARKVARGYNLQRYMNACAGRSGFPIKFNGSLFTVDWNFPQENFDADYRRWGPGYWHQNTRLPYWSMLYAGDFEMMRGFFDMYVNALPLAEERCRRHCGHPGAFFPEVMYFWGGYLEHNYGWPDERPDDLPAHRPQNNYIRRHNSSGLEVLYLALLAYRFSGDRTFLAEYVRPLAGPLIDYYDHHFPRSNGRLHISPAQVIEQWWEATGPLPEIAGLHACLRALLALPNGSFPEDTRRGWRRLLEKIPPLPTHSTDDKTVFSPAQSWEEPPRNVENPELYAVFPYHRCGLDSPDLAVGIETFRRRANTHDMGWAQDGIQAALLGLAGEARESVVKRLTTPSPYARFPAFWGPGFDWIPDQDQGGSAAHALQLMALQVIDKKVHLLPAWPSDWSLDAQFVLPGNRKIALSYRPGDVPHYEWVGGDETRGDWIVSLHQPRD